MNLPASSRENPRVICVRSLVPKLKNSASGAISSAVSAPRGTSIIVPIWYWIFTPYSLHGLFRDADGDGFLILELVDVADERDHDFRNDFDLFLGQFAGRADDRLHLHLGDFRIGDAQAAAAVAEHRIELMELFGGLHDLVGRDADFFGQHFGVFARLRQELVQRRIDRPDRHAVAFHLAEEAFEVLFLERQEFGQGRSCGLRTSWATIICCMNGRRSSAKNMCSVRQRPMPSAPNWRATYGVPRNVGVGADLELAQLVGPAHEHRRTHRKFPARSKAPCP